MQSFQDVLWPEVSSGKVSFGKNDLKYIEPLKQYRMVFSGYGKIEDVEVFYTSYYDQTGRHIARMNWVKYIDFRFDENYIQSTHELNNGEGEHTVVFKYRVPFWNYPSAKRKAEKGLNFWKASPVIFPAPRAQTPAPPRANISQNGPPLYKKAIVSFMTVAFLFFLP